MSEIGPKIPNFIDQIQFITFYVGNPCDVPFMAYIETALPISGEIALVMLGIDIQAFLKRTFRPKWIRSGRHTRRGPRGRRRGGGIPEPAEVIADILDPHGDLRLNKWPMGTYMLIEAWEIVDRVFWTLFVMEMADSLVINSIIGALELDTTNCPNITRFLRIDASGGGGGAGPATYPVSISELRYAVNIPSNSAFQCSLPTGTYVAVFSALINSGSPGMEMTPTLKITQGAEERWVDGPTFQGGNDEWYPFTISTRINGGGLVQWFVKRNAGFFNLSQMRLFIIQIGN